MSILGIARTGTKYLGRLLFDDNFSSLVTKNIKNSKNAAKAAGGKWYTGFHKQVGDAFVSAEKVRAKSGGIFSGLKKSVSNFFPVMKRVWKGKGGFLGKLGKSLKFIGKKLPVIGTALMIGFEIPNIIKASKDKGLIGGVVEAGKSAVRLGAGIGLGAIGAAVLGPIGAIAGFFLGDWLGKKVVGKSYSEKEAEKEEQLAQAQAQQAQQEACANGQCCGAQPTFNGNGVVQQPGATNPFYPNQMPPIAPYDDIMFNATFQQPQRLNYQA